MKTSGFRCETKFGLLVSLGHPNCHPPMMCTGWSIMALLGPKMAKHSKLVNVPNGPYMVPNGQEHVIMAIWDHLGSVWTILGHWQACHVVLKAPLE